MDLTCGLRRPKTVNSGLSWAGAELDMGRGPDLGSCCLGVVGQPEGSGGSRETPAASGQAAGHGCPLREAGLSCGVRRGAVRPEPVGPLRKAHRTPCLPRGLRRRQGAAPLVWRCYGARKWDRRLRRSLIGVLKEMRRKEAGRSAQALGRREEAAWWRQGRECLPSPLALGSSSDSAFSRTFLDPSLELEVPLPLPGCSAHLSALSSAGL